jgi:short-chain fatty acids transporter
MLSRFAARLADWAQRWVPDPFVIALGLTALTFALGWATMPEPSARMLAAGWWARVTAGETLTFTTQMCLVLVAGSALARAPAVRGLLARLADVPQSTASAAALTSLVAMLGAFLNWGFGLVAGAVLAREIAARASAAGRKLDYPLVAAAGYVGLMVWHGGLSGSAPLKVAESGPVAGAAPIPLSETTFAPYNLALTVGVLVVVPWLFARMASPGKERHWPVPPLELPRDDESGARAGSGLGALLLLAFTVLLGVLALDGAFEQAGLLRGLSLNVVILLLLLAGLLLFRSPQRYATAFGASAGEAGGILLQFPFYFGILGLLEASGLVQRLAGGSADAARALAALGLPLQWSYDMVVWLSAAVVNLFVPSGGGQWAVQGQIVVHAAGELHLSVPRAVMALAYGDEWTNMLQPFWALPLLGITGLKARDILGYSLAIMLLAGPLYALALLFF